MNPCFRAPIKLGFQAFANLTTASDYSFKLWRNGDFEYADFAGEDTGYGRTGSPPFDLEMWEERTQAMSLSEMTEPAHNEHKIADLPEMNILIKQEASTWRRTLQPNYQVALKIHRLIQEVVMRVSEILKSEFQTFGKILGGGFPLISQPRILQDAKSAKAIIKERPLSHVDWDSQQVLLFSPWSGSGQDSLIAYAVDSEANETQYKSGRTRDLRVHAKAWVIDKNQLWRFHLEE